MVLPPPGLIPSIEGSTPKPPPSVPFLGSMLATHKKTGHCPVFLNNNIE